MRLGASGLFANDQVSAEQRARAQEILAAVGLALWVEKNSSWTRSPPSPAAARPISSC